LVSVFDQFNLDGIDIDWEYPGRDGDAGNEVATDDSACFLLFLQLLRDSLPSYARLSAAVAPVPFIGPNGEPLNDVSSFATVLDWVLIMNYDTWSGKLLVLINRCISYLLTQFKLQATRDQMPLSLTDAVIHHNLKLVLLQRLILGLLRVSRRHNWF
jgi:hypothetical protein